MDCFENYQCVSLGQETIHDCQNYVNAILPVNARKNVEIFKPVSVYSLDKGLNCSVGSYSKQNSYCFRVIDRLVETLKPAVTVNNYDTRGSSKHAVLSGRAHDSSKRGVGTYGGRIQSETLGV